MVGAGYAFLASTASSSGNSLDGDVIAVTIGTNEAGDNWANASADFKISYGSYYVNGTETAEFYVEGPQKIGTGTLKIDATTHDGEEVTVAKVGNIDEIHKSLKGAMSLDIKFIKANGAELGDSDSQSEFKIENGSVILEFEIEVNFDSSKGELTKGTLPVAGKESREVYFINEATRAGLIEPIEYTVLFSVFPVDGSGSEFNTP
jgi:hypothetical protein